MNKKNIQLGIVIVAFSAMGIVLYKGFFSGGAASPNPFIASLSASATPASVLPYGATFNYQAIDSLQKQGFQFGVVQYPEVSTSTDVGKAPNDLITPLLQPGP
jgi:hypothetical protein